jgi:hypothetical protein
MPRPPAPPLLRAVLLLAFALAAAPAAAKSLALMGLRAGEGATEQLTDAVADALVSELRRAGATLITQDEVGAIVGLERQREVLGCDQAACYAELSGALGVDELVTGGVSKLGTSWMIILKRIDLQQNKVVAQSDRRLKGGSVDDLLDVLPAMTRELLGGLSSAGGAAAPTPAATNTPAPSAFRELPLKEASERQGLSLWRKPGTGAGLVALKLEAQNRSPVFYGDGKKFFRLRTEGGGKSGPTHFYISLLDPRFRDGWQRSLAHKDGVMTVQCGDKKITLAPVPTAEGEALLRGAAFFEPRLARRAVELALDDQGNTVLVDQAGAHPDATFGVFMGVPGSFRFIAVRSSQSQGEQRVYFTEVGKLVFDRVDGKNTARWHLPTGVAELTPMSVWENEAKIYTTWDVYGQKDLGVPCDGEL